MRILAVADVHGAYDVVEQIVRREAVVDLLLIAGDLTTNGTASEAGRALDQFGALGPRVLAVGGNMDPVDVDREFIRRGVSLNGCGVVVQDVAFFGLSGAPLSPLHTPSEYPEEDLLRQAEAGWEQVKHAPQTIFIPHAPPHGTTLDMVAGGRHVGSTAVRDFILRHRPDLTICGHIHESHGSTTLGGVPVINIGPAYQGHFAVITFDRTITVSAARL